MNRTLIFVFAALLLATEDSEAQQFAVPASAEAAIVYETNAYRKVKGLPPLHESESASRVAQAYARYLAETNRTGHRADERDPVQRLRAASVKFCKFQGENWHASWTRRVKASPDAAVVSAMRFWKKSPGHERALRSASTEIGVGVAGWKHGDKWYYQEIQLFIDTSCLKRADVAVGLPDRNPLRPQMP